MSPSNFCCIICGYFIESFGPVDWLKEFRIIYCSTQGTFISGVGRHSDPYTIDWIAPSDSASRWDDPGYTPSSSDRIPVMRQDADGGLHGFVMHDLCWQLLQKFYEPDDVPVARLLDI
ncbi:hypothetical protein GTR04_3449 [Trichophyton interdigitale]|nr:hypothetical protein GY632_6198 [Trichophyton interdigitale]KAG8209190.1 hypothetical protein GTR04_3449 [Trichophyton interdigitale]